MSIRPASNLEKPLMQRSVSVMTLPPGVLIASYQWSSTNTILALARDPDAGYDFHAATIQPQTGTITFLQQNYAVTKYLSRCTFSPDGKWYLGISYGNFWNSSEYSYYLCTTDESRQEIITSTLELGALDKPFAWFTDSQHWICLSGMLESLEIQSLFDPIGHTLEIPAALKDCHLLLSAEPHPMILANRLWYEEPVDAIKVGTWDLESPEKISTYTITLPVSSGVMDVTIAPSGDRFAWLLYCNDNPPANTGPDRWQRLLSCFRGRKTHPASYQLWTTALDGASPQLLGGKDIYLEWEDDRRCAFAHGWFHRDIISKLAWTSDSTKVSFFYGPTLYLVDTREAVVEG